MRRKHFFKKSFSDKENNNVAITSPNLISPTQGTDNEQQKTTPTSVLRYHINDEREHKYLIQSYSFSSTAKKIPTIFSLIDKGDWVRVEEHAKQYPSECNVWVSLVRKATGSGSSNCSSVDGRGRLSSPYSISSITSLETSTSSVSTAMACNRTSHYMALHHACKKLRSVHVQVQRLIQIHRSNNGDGTGIGKTDNGLDEIASKEYISNETWRHGVSDGSRDEADDKEPYDDPWLQACRAILTLIEVNPKAAGERESRHGCLPLHLAAFSMRRTNTSIFDNLHRQLMVSAPSNVIIGEGKEWSGEKLSVSSSSAHPPSRQRPESSHSTCSNPGIEDKFSFMDACSSGSSCCFTAMLDRDEGKCEMKLPLRKHPLFKQQSHVSSLPTVIHRNPKIDRPACISTRNKSTESSLSSASATFPRANLNALSLSQQPRIITPTETQCPHVPSIKHFNDRIPPFNLKRYLLNQPLRDRYSILVIQALQAAYPPAPRIDSEGGRLPLHMALEGRATLPVIQALIESYPAAVRTRIGNGFLPLHLAAEKGVGDAGVAGALLSAYPDGGIARNHFDRTPLQEAMLAAGENGREFQVDFIKSIVGWGGEQGGRVMGMSGHNLLAREEVEEVVNRLVHGNQHENITSVTPNTQTIINLVQSHRWEDLIILVEDHPNIVKKKIHATTRTGIPSQTTLLYLVSEQNPSYEVIDVLVNTYRHAVLYKNNPGGQTCLHAACTWGASEDVVGYLLAASGVSFGGGGGGGGARQRDALGNLPLHAACYSGASSEVISMLLCTLPKAVEARNIGGFLPSDVVKRLWKERRGGFVREMIEQVRIELEKEKQSKESDDSERDQGEDRKENRINRVGREGKEQKSPIGMSLNGKAARLNILKNQKVGEVKEEKDGLIWV